MTGLVWLALDGVGHPADAPPKSVWETELPALRPLVGGGEALGATLGVPGLPQSGTGQSCWLTGRDAVRVMGEHFGPHPGPTLRRLLAQEGLPVRLTRAGGRAALANHYPPAYHAAQARRPRPGCFPWAFQAAGLPLGPPDVPPVSPTLGLGYAAPWPEETPLAGVARLGERLARAARTHDLIAADLWLSDLLGHRGQMPVPADALAAGRAYLRRVDALLAGLLEGGARVIVSSDHGNLENLRIKGHTLARVPFAGAGLTLPPARDIVGGGRAIAAVLGLAVPGD